MTGKPADNLAEHPLISWLWRECAAGESRAALDEWYVLSEGVDFFDLHVQGQTLHHIVQNQLLACNLPPTYATQQAAALVRLFGHLAQGESWCSSPLPAEVLAEFIAKLAAQLDLLREAAQQPMVADWSLELQQQLDNLLRGFIYFFTWQPLPVFLLAVWSLDRLWVARIMELTAAPLRHGSADEISSALATAEKRLHHYHESVQRAVSAWRGGPLPMCPPDQIGVLLQRWASFEQIADANPDD